MAAYYLHVWQIDSKKTKYAGQTRYYIHGIRVSRDTYEDINNNADRKDSFYTKFISSLNRFKHGHRIMVEGVILKLFAPGLIENLEMRGK